MYIKGYAFSIANLYLCSLYFDLCCIHPNICGIQDCSSVCTLRLYGCLYAGSSGKASHQDAQAVHSLLKDDFNDEEAAAQWFTKCQSVFCWSQYFAGSKRLHIQSSPDSNGVLVDKVADLSLNGHK